MRLGQILEDVKVRMPNAFEEDSLVIWLDSALRDIYKVLALREGFTFSAVHGQSVYPLPADISCDLVSAVVVDGKELTARRIGDDVVPNCWSKVTEGFIALHPAQKFSAGLASPP